MTLREIRNKRLQKIDITVVEDNIVESNERIEDEQVECGYHLCRKSLLKSVAYECEWCYKYFCDKHKKPKIPMSFPGSRTGKEASKNMEIYKEPGHPCPPYASFKMKYE